jgi:ribosome-associated protein
LSPRASALPRLECGRPSEEPIIEPRELAALAARIALSKKGIDVKVFDVSEHIKIASYFVVVTGLSRPHVKAIYSEIHAQFKELGERHSKAEGTDLGWWVLVDFVDVVVHILQPEARRYYDLDTLYGECPLLDHEAVALPVATASATAGKRTWRAARAAE